MFCTQSCEHHINATSSGRVLASNGMQQQQQQQQQQQVQPPEQQNINKGFLIPAPGLEAVSSQLGVCIVTETPEGLSFDCNVPLPNCYDFDAGHQPMSVKTPPVSVISSHNIESPFEPSLLYQPDVQPFPEEQPVPKDCPYIQCGNAYHVDCSQTKKPEQQPAVHNIQSLQQIQPRQFHLQLPIFFGNMQSAPAPCTHQLTSFCDLCQTISQQPWQSQAQSQLQQQLQQQLHQQLHQQPQQQSQQQTQWQCPLQQQPPQQQVHSQQMQQQLPPFLGDQSVTVRSFDVPCRIMEVRGTNAGSSPMQPMFILEILPQEHATQDIMKLNQQTLPMPSMSSFARCSTETPRKSTTWAPMNICHPCTSSSPPNPSHSISKRVPSNATAVSNGQESRKSETCFSHRRSSCRARTANGMGNRNESGNRTTIGNALGNTNGNSQNNRNRFEHRNGIGFGGRNNKDAYKTSNGYTMGSRNGNGSACGYGSGTTFGRANAYGHARGNGNCNVSEYTNNGWHRSHCSYWVYPAAVRQSSEWNQRF